MGVPPSPRDSHASLDRLLDSYMAFVVFFSTNLMIRSTSDSVCQGVPILLAPELKKHLIILDFASFSELGVDAFICPALDGL